MRTRVLARRHMPVPAAACLAVLALLVVGSAPLAEARTSEVLPTTPILDNFNRANEAPLSQGGAWAPNDIAGIGPNTFSIVGQEMYHELFSPDPDQDTVYRVQSYPGDVEVHVKLVFADYTALLFNIREEGSLAYDAYALVWADLQGGDNFFFKKITNGNWSTTLAELVWPESTIEAVPGDRLLVRRTGSTMEGWVLHQSGSSTLALTATDSEYVGGKIGHYADYTETLDDFGGGTIGAPPPPPTITTTSLPGGTANQAYSQSVTATSGTTPYSWTISGGSLPPGLGLSPTGTPSATISGTPTSFGTYDFTVRVTDSAAPSATDTQDLSITVAPPPPNPPLLDNFNRPPETPVSQGGNWAATGINGGSGAPLSNNRLRNFPVPGYSYRVRPYLGGNMEAAATVLVKPTSTHSLSVFICLQDVGTSAWDGYELKLRNVGSGADIWEIWRIDNGSSNPPTPLASTNLEAVAGGKMLLRSVGGWLQFWWKPPSGVWQMKLGDESSLLDLTYQWGMIGAGGVQSGALDDFSGGSLLSPLEQYAPELRHSAFDTFRAGSAGMMTDNVSDSGIANALHGEDASILAQSNWNPPDQLWIGFLNATYPPGGIADGQSATASDYLDAVDSHTADAQRMQAIPTYGNKVYAREVAETGGRKTLQYWLFYYFNWHPTIGTEADHEGDWEMVQFELDAYGVPTRAAYSQHDDGEVCLWSFVERTSDGKPVVYSARGTHASYFRSGTKPGQIPLFPDNDYADGNATPVTPSIFNLEAPAPGWLNWPGRWGDDAGTFPSPVGPKQQGTKWSPSPADWADDQEGCWEVLGFRERGRDAAPLGGVASPTPAPSIVAKRVERRVRIQYSFSAWPSDPARRPVMLLTSVQSSGPRYAPYMKRHRISKRRSVVWQPLGLGKGPFKLFAAAYSREGKSSKTVTVRVRNT